RERGVRAGHGPAAGAVKSRGWKAAPTWLSGVGGPLQGDSSFGDAEDRGAVPAAGVLVQNGSVETGGGCLMRGTLAVARLLAASALSSTFVIAGCGQSDAPAGGARE